MVCPIRSIIGLCRDDSLLLLSDFAGRAGGNILTGFGGGRVRCECLINRRTKFMDDHGVDNSKDPLVDGTSSQI